MISSSIYPLAITGSVVLLVMAVAVMGLVTWSYDMRRERLPQATQWDNLSERLSGLEVQIADKQAELKALQQESSDRDRIAGEVASLTKQRDDLRLELSTLAESDRQIDETKRRAAEAAIELDVVKGKLDEAKLALDSAKSEKEKLQDEIDEIKKTLQIIQELPKELQKRIDVLRSEIARLGDEMSGLRGERAQLIAAREELASLAIRKAALEQEVTALTELKQRQSALQIELNRTISEKQEEKASLIAEVSALQSAREEIAQISARKAALEVEVERLLGDSTGTPTGGMDASDLKELPLCLRIEHIGERKAQLEIDALYEVYEKLRDYGLKYNTRTVDAFHTTLKINDIAQLTVLSGVSGTGKSLLPRRYAEAMGINFLQIAVEPRWDSPQDLLGFYNYVEKRYRGTDLARALVHMDPFNTSGLAEKTLGDQMLLVLLDEMNLARVEYYFSEFLSRLEVRPRWSENIDLEERNLASLPLDTRGTQGRTIRLFPSHNVLFSGTMNDDESTQALSDKVLDRGNIMQFPAPASFEKPASAAKSGAGSGYYRSHDEWRKWVQPTGSLRAAEAEKAAEVINKLAEIMQRCGRPFGHRLNEAMLSYVANYPTDTAGHRQIEPALADQVEFRILPKLRGVVLDEGEAPSALQDLARLLRENLQDGIFAQQLDNTLGRGASQFNWRGIDRS